MRTRILSLILLLTPPVWAQTYNLFSNPHTQYLDTSGRPLAGGRIFTYQAGTVTPQVTYRDISGATPVPNTNPVVLDSGGFATIYLDQSKNYKMVLKNALGVQQWSVDNISGTGSTSVALSSITPAVNINTIQNGSNQQVWNWSLTGATSMPGISFSEQYGNPSTNTGPSSVLVAINTTGNSTIAPLQATAHDGAAGLKVATGGDVQLVGTSRLYGGFGSLYQAATAVANYNLWSGAHWNGSATVSDYTGNIAGIGSYGGTTAIYSNAGTTAGTTFNPLPIVQFTPSYTNNNATVINQTYTGTNVVGAYLGVANTSGPLSMNLMSGAHPNGSNWTADITGNIGGIGWYGATTTISGTQGLTAGQAFNPTVLANFTGNGAYLYNGIEATNGLQHKRSTAGSTCVTAAAAGASCPTTITWNPAFNDNLYSVSCQGVGTLGGGVPVIGAVTSKAAGTLTVLTVAVTAAAAQFSGIDCIAMHD
jgi:hypothetical protein